MGIRTTDIPGAPPTDIVVPPVDEGPMRRELMRQIAVLDAALAARTPGLASERTTPRRGPAVQPTRELELIRDELFAALKRA
jgi:hypothetical protein